MVSDFTVEEDMAHAAHLARERAAEVRFFRDNQPHYPRGFGVIYRNPGHWDITARQCPGKASAWAAANPKGFTSAQDGCQERAFRIRGEPGEVVVFDERWDPTRKDREPLTFRSVAAAMLWISEELMQEPHRMSSKPPFRTGDSVVHGPTGETWVVAYADPVTGYMSWLGWPEGEAKISDCALDEAVSDEKHHEWLLRLKQSGGPRAARAIRLYGDPGVVPDTPGEVPYCPEPNPVPAEES